MFLPNFLRKYFPLIKEYELATIRAVAALADDTEQQIIAAQLKLICNVQRYSGGKEVLLYDNVKGRELTDNSLLLPFSHDAEIYGFVNIQTEGTFFCEALIWQVKGRIFAIEYDIFPYDFRKRHYEFVGATRLCNLIPQRAPLLDQDFSPQERRLELIRESLSLSDITQAYAPVAEEFRNLIIDGLNLRYPHDYRDMLSLTDGFTTKDIMIYGIGNIQTAVTDDYNYIILAERESFGMLLLRKNDLDMSVYYYNFESDEIVCVGNSFAAAIKHLSSQK